jgi:hypothetical protein
LKVLGKVLGEAEKRIEIKDGRAAAEVLSATNTKVIEQLRLKLPQTNLPQRKGTN